jgi:peroxiredoxin
VGRRATVVFYDGTTTARRQRREAELSSNVNADGIGDARRETRSRPYLFAFTLLLLVGSTTLNVFLARRVESLRRNLLYVKSENRLAAGASVQAIEAKDLDGRPTSIAYANSRRPTVIYVFSPSCGWCAKNLSNIKTLASQVNGQYQFVALSLSTTDLREYVSEHNFDFPVYCEPTPAAITSYKMGGTPQTIVISEDGKVLKNWYGAYMGGTQKEVEEYFHLRLPGLAQERAN